MYKSLSRTYRSHILSITKLSLLMIVIVGSSYAIFNAVKLDNLSKSIVNDFKQIYSISRRFAQYYNNTNTVELEKGLYVRNGVSIMVNKDTDAKVLSVGINKLRSELELIAQDNIWTIAIFENPADYSHFSPLRKEYQERYSSYQSDDVVKRIVKLERLENTFDQFYGCNIKLSETYREDGSGQLVRTIYYPVYNERKLDALLAIDVKASFVDLVIDTFNHANFTAANTQFGIYSYQQPVEIPCTDAQPIIIGFSLWDILKPILLPAIFIAFLIHAIVVFIKSRQLRIKRDKMTGFYRRDFYEPKLKKAYDFSMLIIDIDFFKVINDTHGHKVGDEVITEVTRRISSQIRSNDVAVRWGGEEFLVLFKDMTDEMLYDKAELIRQYVAHKPISDIEVTISVGGVILRDQEFNEAYKRADHALYQSKRDGRNRVTIYEATTS
ncbi:GGDEF domain-containing protein [Vibrio sinensis]|uniref:diguanylate cyclase n=1 Tax=Vibrio sinensis TaxID=2302434 RepID=A0A3A6QWS8_9VIBR|nr:GGDEF domain-containing protein [Vibrio sinensis]RJX66496.1 GGDEF domain-containing protein [Vibrio sinensis]